MAKRTTVLFPKTIELLREPASGAFAPQYHLRASGGTGRNQPGDAVAD